MIRMPLLIGSMLLAGAGAAFAQGAPPPPPSQTENGAPPRPPMMGGMMGPGGMMGHGGMMEMRRERMMMAQKAAAFRFRRDGAEIDIKCAADEPMKACVDAAGVLIDKIVGAPAK